MRGKSERHSLTFFVDTCLGRHVAGVVGQDPHSAEYLDDHFASSTADPDWIAQIAPKGWVILSADKAMSVDHLAALKESQAVAFLLCATGLNGADMARVFTHALAKIEKHVKDYRPPLIVKLYRDGRMVVVEGERRGGFKKDPGKAPG